MRRTSLISNQLAEELGRRIVAGGIPSHTAMATEAELGQQYGASRTAVREALKILTAKGLMSTRPRVGGVVRPDSDWSVLDPDVLRWMRDSEINQDLLRDLAMLRFAIEPEAAALAALRRDADLVAAIAQALDAMKGAPQDVLAADIAFHKALLKASGNRFFATLGEMVESALSMSITTTNAAKGRQHADYAEHKAIYDAIVAGNAGEARARSRALIEETVRLLGGDGIL